MHRANEQCLRIVTIDACMPHLDLLSSKNDVRVACCFCSTLLSRHTATVPQSCLYSSDQNGLQAPQANSFAAPSHRSVSRDSSHQPARARYGCNCCRPVHWTQTSPHTRLNPAHLTQTCALDLSLHTELNPAEHSVLLPQAVQARFFLFGLG